MTKNQKLNLSAVCTALSGPAAIEMLELPLPALESQDVLIAVEAAALNFPDLLMTRGKYQFRPELPFVIGMEGAGIVQSTGSLVQRFKPGDFVIFKGKTGACSHLKIARESNISLMPKNLNFEEAAAFGVTFMTAYVALAKRGKLRAGETLLVHGAGGGVGQACVAVGKTLGATVIAVASSLEKRQIALKSGADHVIDTQNNSFPDTVLDLTNGQGVDVVLDPVGGAVLNNSVKCLAWQGRILTVGFASGDFGDIDLVDLQRCSGSLVGVRAGEYGRKNPEAGKRAYEELLQLVEDYDLRPHIGKVWAEADVGLALKSMEDRGVAGKQVIKIK